MDRVTYNTKIGSTVYVITTDTADKKYKEYILKKVEKMMKRSIEIPVSAPPKISQK